MAQTIIEENGDFALLADGNGGVTKTAKTAIYITENSAGATVALGYDSDGSGTFKAFSTSSITDDRLVECGKGLRLMVRVSGIAADSVTLRTVEA